MVENAGKIKIRVFDLRWGLGRKHRLCSVKHIKKKSKTVQNKIRIFDLEGGLGRNHRKIKIRVIM